MTYLLESEFNIGIKKGLVTFSQAMERDDSRKSINAMNEEWKLMNENGVWNLIELPTKCNKVGCK